MINLDKSFHEMVGSHIPFRKLGFHSLESFIKSLKDAFVVQNDRSNRMKVELKPHSDQNIDHIQDLVRNQISQGPSRAKSQPYWGRGRDGRNRFSTLAQSYSGSKIPPFELQQKIIVLIKENGVCRL